MTIHQVAPSIELSRGLVTRERFRAVQSSVVWVALLVLIAYGFVGVARFDSPSNTTALLALAAPLVITAIGQTFVFAVGGMDLSVGMLMGLVGVLSAGLMANQNSHFLPVVLLMLLLGIAVGTFTGGVAAITGFNAIILTLGVAFVLEGGAYLYSAESISPVPSYLEAVEGATVAGIPLITAVWVVLGVLAWLVLARSPLGVHMRAVGGSEASALKAGIRVKRVKVIAYALSGLCGAISGILLASRLGSGYPLAGQGMELNAIVAVIVGGTPYGGGRATMVGSIGGALLLTCFGNVLGLLGVEPYVSQVAVGLFTMMAVALSRSGKGRHG